MIDTSTESGRFSLTIRLQSTKVKAATAALFDNLGSAVGAAEGREGRMPPPHLRMRTGRNGLGCMAFGFAALALMYLRDCCAPAGMCALLNQDQLERIKACYGLK